MFDLGNFSDNPTTEGTMKTQGLVEGMVRLGYAAGNVAERELSLGYDEFLRRTEGAAFPFVSANIVRQDTREPIFNPYVVIEIHTADSDQPVRVGVMGVVRFNPVFLKSGPDGSNLVVAPPREMVKRYVGDLRERSDVVVLLAALHKDEARLIAQEVPGIDIILGSYGAIYSTREESEGDTQIFYSGNQGRRIGETRVFLNAERRLETTTSFMHFLTARYPSDEEMTEFVGQVLNEIGEYKRGQEEQKVGQLNSLQDETVVPTGPSGRAHPKFDLSNRRPEGGLHREP